MRRWRGFIDVPVTAEGLQQASDLGRRLRLDLIYHDHLSRDRDTAAALRPTWPLMLLESDGPRPWHMGPQFEGWPITRESLRHAQYLAVNSQVCPVGGEAFGWWYKHWTKWIDGLQTGGLRVGIVTHNRNLQVLYSRQGGKFYPKLYDRIGPAPLSVHVFSGGVVAPWGERSTPPGIYLIRHAPTEWGT